MDDFATWAEASALGHAARASGWLYPVANLLHLLGLVLLLGPIGLVDLRLVGAFRALPLAPLRRALVPLAMTGVVLLAASGAVLFAADAAALIRAPLFRAKLLLILLALANALLFERLWREGAPVRPRQRAMAAASIAMWLAVAALGRLIAYR